MSTINLAVISDLHCSHSSKDEKKDCKLHSDDLGTSDKRHPVKSLLKLIKKENLSSDLVLCPGDITNCADKQGLITGWSFLKEIRSALNATDIIATIGNHDIDSRNLSLGNVFSEIKYLDDNYPLPNVLKDEYWSNGYSFWKSNDILILNINTCYYHGNHVTVNESKIDQAQLDKIESLLDSENLETYNYRIALCHHHIIAHSNLDYSDSDKLDKGDNLALLLRKFNFQIVIHGHKHDPRLTMYNRLPIFCAGSFSSRMNTKDLEIQNTFHIVTLEKNHPTGYIRSWIHQPTEGWLTKLDTYFPCFTGFGFNGDISNLASQIKAWFDSRSNPIYKYEDLTKSFNTISNMTKEDQFFLSHELSKSGIVFHPPYPNLPKIIATELR